MVRQLRPSATIPTALLALLTFPGPAPLHAQDPPETCLSVEDVVDLGALADSASVQILRLSDSPDGWQDGFSVALTSDGDTFWVLGAIRRLSQEREEELVDAAPRPGIERMRRFRRQSAGVRNAVYDGALIRVDRGGSVVRGVTFEEYPWGFVGPDRFYTFAEEPSGLVKIRIWRFRDVCGAG